MDYAISSSNSGKVVNGNMPANIEAHALIVDDLFVIRKIHTDLLYDHGFRTFTAENGKQAVELCESGQYFDFIVMDFQMPIMDGVEATKRLREMGVDCRIIAVTSASNDNIVKERFREAGADHVFPKPLTADNLAISLNNTRSINQNQQPATTNHQI